MMILLQKYYRLSIIILLAGIFFVSFPERFLAGEPSAANEGMTPALKDRNQAKRYLSDAKKDSNPEKKFINAFRCWETIYSWKPSLRDNSDLKMMDEALDLMKSSSIQLNRIHLSGDDITGVQQ